MPLPFTYSERNMGMTDTYTVAATPVQEDKEVSQIREYFDKAMNALITSTQLAKDVDQLKSDLDQLRTQVNHYRNTIANQDEQITRLRMDRDAARTAQYQAEDNQRHMATELENAKRDVTSLSDSNVRLNDRVSELVKERDDALLKIMELEDNHRELSEKFNRIRDMLGLPIEPPKPVLPTPMPVLPETKPYEYTEPVSEPVTEHEPTQEPKSTW